MFIWIRLLEASMVGGICIVLFLLVSSLFGERYRASYKKVVWLLIALRMCIPISFSFFPKAVTVQVPVYVLRENSREANMDSVLPEETTTGEESLAVTASAPEDEGGYVSEQPSYRGQFTSLYILALLWGVGSGAVLLFYLLVYFSFCRKMLKHSEICQDRHILDTTAEIAGKMGLKRLPEIRLIRDFQTGPFTVGFFRNVVFLPDCEYQERDLQYIVRHELAHCAGRDTQIKLLLVFVNAIHWFNPLAWLMKALADQDMELACDEKVLGDASKEERSEYSEVLLSCIDPEASGKPVLSTAYVQGVKFIKRRFRNILHMRKKSGKAAGSVMVALLIAVSAAIGLDMGRTVYAGSGIAIDCGIELRTDVTGDGLPDQVRVFDNNDVLITSVTLDTADGQQAQFDYDEELWAASYLISGDLSGNRAADIVLMRVSFGSHLTGQVSVLYVSEESGVFIWKEYPEVFIRNPAIDMEQPETFEELECLGATVIEEGGRQYLRLVALDMEYFAESMGDDDQVLCIDCSWHSDGWFIEDIQTVPGYYSENREDEILKNNIYHIE